MGKIIRAQRIGKGGPIYKSCKHFKIGDITYNQFRTYLRQSKVLIGKIIEFRHERGRSAPLAIVKLETGPKILYLPPKGAYVGQQLKIGNEAEPKVGNILPLAKIPEGMRVFNIEKEPFDGGKFAKSAGACGIIVSKDGNWVRVKLPSGKEKTFNANCLATVGVAAAGGVKEKPFLKAGTKKYYARSRRKKWPVVRGVAMNPVDHPHGGGSHQHPGSSTTVSRGTPPGRKVGHIAARRTGRKR